MRKLSLTWPLALLFLFTSFLGACTKEEDDPEPTPTNTKKYWEMGVQGSNFSINSKDITIHDDGVSVDYNNYYVLVNALPTSDFEFYTLHLLVPTDSKEYITDVTDVSAVVSYAGQETGNVYTGGEFVDQVELNGTDYSRYRIEMRDNSMSANAATFENVVVSARVAYKDGATKSVVNSRTVKVEVYKRN